MFAKDFANPLWVGLISLMLANHTAGWLITDYDYS